MLITAAKGYLAHRTRELLQMFLDGYSVSGLCNELGMKRTAVLRALQRAHQRNPKFPRRDPDTDRAEWYSIE